WRLRCPQQTTSSSRHPIFGLPGWEIKSADRILIEVARILVLEFPCPHTLGRIGRRRGAGRLAAWDRRERIPAVMHRRRRIVCALAWFCASVSGCAIMRSEAPSPDLRPCTDGYAYTADGW